ncbi:nuclear transport factor 2 family protein [Herbidospora sp. NEAU-GS84]|uniref:Nuclear transport factor 2 family protein n=1 Tax=Herbidospora solisilvae TaxID=2696284 RepID=A0A7C9P2U3_9ACTN|nr:nuclear transport factor 2 family protein [Herbidospora solisilvae]NAS26857.1 nuclear transport factor 2 family protein [Herbidospora solisilvae]
MDPLLPAIQQMIDATNRGDGDALLGAFAEDAVVNVFGRTFEGRDRIAEWNAQELIGAHTEIVVTGARTTGESTTVAVTVSGEGYNGPGTLTFRTHDTLIDRLDVT